MRGTERARRWQVFVCVFFLQLMPVASWAQPQAEIAALQARIKKTKTIAKYIKLSLRLGHLYRTNGAYDKALAVYRALGKKYNKADVLCVVQHFSAQTLLKQKKEAAASSIYKRMMKRFRRCQCRYLPNAYIALGRAAFDRKEYQEALRLYSKAPKCRKNRIAAIAAAYMKGWSAYKIGRYKTSLRSLLATMRELKRQKRRFRGEQRKKLDEVQKEGLPNLVRAYNRAGNPRGALRAFRRVADNTQLDKMLKQLSDSYHTTKSYKKLLALYKELARAHRRSPKQVRDWLEIVRACFRLDKNREMMRSLKQLSRAILRYKSQASSDKALKRDIADAQDQLHRFGLGKRREARKTNNMLFYKQSEVFLEVYRKLFPKAKDAHKKAYWHGEVLLVRKKYKQAAAAYTACARSPHPFKFKEDAAYKAALASHRRLKAGQPLQYKKPSASKRAKAKRMAEKFKSFLAAARAYKKQYPQGKEVPYVTYNMGLVYQMHQDWDKAREAFVEVVQKHPKTRYARPAAYHVVDTLRIRQAWEKLHKWSRVFGSMSGFGTPLFQRQMQRMSRAAKSKSCFELDNKKKYTKAARCYEHMAKELGKHRDTPIMLYNAYVAFKRAKMMKRSAAMKKQLLAQYPRSRPARMLLR